MTMSWKLRIAASGLILTATGRIGIAEEPQYPVVRVAAIPPCSHFGYYPTQWHTYPGCDAPGLMIVRPGSSVLPAPQTATAPIVIPEPTVGPTPPVPVVPSSAELPSLPDKTPMSQDGYNQRISPTSRPPITLRPEADQAIPTITPEPVAVSGANEPVGVRATLGAPRPAQVAEPPAKLQVVPAGAIQWQPAKE